MTDPARALAIAMGALNRARREQVRLLRGTVVTWNATDGYVVNVSGTEIAAVPGTAALVSDGALVPGDVVSVLDYKSSPHVLGKAGVSGGPAAISAAQVGFTASDIGGVEVAFGAAPVSPSAGELWFDSANGYRLNQWTGTAWQPYQFTSAALDAAAGITAGQVAFSASEIGGVSVTISGTAPSSPATGDLWYDAGNGYVLKQWSGSAWTPYQWGSGALASGAVGTAQIAAGAVGSSQVSFSARAIGGITTTVSGTAPSGPVTGDLWFDSGNGYRVNQWSGTAWVPYQYGTGALAAGSVTAAVIAAGTITATQIQAGTITASQIAAGTITAANIAANAITAAQIAANTITASQVAAGTITANEIATATITATQLAAGIVYAGIVDATTIQGASLIADGTSGEILAYSGAPAAGNLIMSFSPAAGTDAFGNAYPQGLQVGADSDNQITLNPVVNQPFDITSAISGVLQAAAELTTSDAAEVFPGLFGSVVMGTGTSSKMAAALTSPVGTGSGAALLLQAENDANTDTPVVITGSVSSPDGSTLVINPIQTLSAYAQLLYGGVSGQTVQTFTSSTTWTCPVGVTSVKAEVWAAGGGGGGGGTTGGGGGGGGGSYSVNPAYTVIPGNNYTVTVGAGGAGGAGAGNGASGSGTSFDGSGVTAIAGAGGVGNFGSGNVGGSGGIGTTKHSGGAGGAGAFQHRGGGGGGGSGGTSSNGNTGTTPTGTGGGAGGAAVPGGAKGGYGGAIDTAGTAGTAPGGGGGGGGGRASGTDSGGAGARGQVRLTWLPSGAAPGILCSVAAAAGSDQFGSTYPAGLSLNAAAAVQSVAAIVSGAAETWHAVSLPSGWTGSARVKILAEAKFACFDFNITGGTGTSIAFGTFPSTAYYPQALKTFPLGYSGGSTLASNPRLNINVASSGPSIASASLSGVTISMTVIYPLD